MTVDLRGSRAVNTVVQAARADSLPAVRKLAGDTDTRAWNEFVGPNEARYNSYWMTVFGAVGQEVPTRVAAAGRGIDTVVRVNGEWLIKSRDVAPK